MSNKYPQIGSNMAGITGNGTQMGPSSDGRSGQKGKTSNLLDAPGVSLAVDINALHLCQVLI